MTRIAILVIALGSLAACSSRAPSPSASPARTTPDPASRPICERYPEAAADRRELERLGLEVLAHIESRHPEELAPLIHPARGLSLGILGSVSHGFSRSGFPEALADPAQLPWDGRSNAADEPMSISVAEIFERYAEPAYSRADSIGYGAVVLEDPLCGGSCVEEALDRDFPCDARIQYAYPTMSPGNTRMWHFLVLAFARSDAGFGLVGIVQDEWSP